VRTRLPDKSAAAARGWGARGCSRLAEVADGHRHGYASFRRLALSCASSSRAALTLCTPRWTGCAGLTPLMWALRFGHLHVARELLAAGARVDVCDAFGRQPLRHAASAARADGVRLVLAQGGVDVDARDHKGWSALARAAFRGNATTVSVLLSAGATPSAYHV